MSDDRFGAIAIQPDPAPPSQRPKKPTRPKPGQRSKPHKPTPDHKKTPRWPILAAIPVVLLLLYGVGGFLLGPTLVTGYLSDSLQQMANMGFTAGEARFNPFTMGLQLHDVTSDADGDIGQSGQSSAPEVPFFKADRVAMDLNMISLLRSGLACNQLEIQGLTISLTRYPDKSYNLPPPAKSAEAPAAAPLFFSLNNISISDSQILFDDRLTGKKHRVEQIKLDLPTLSNTSFAAKEYIRPHFSATINGSPVELSGEAAIAGTTTGGELATNLACNISNLDLPLYCTYLPEALPFKLNKGAGNGKLRISFVPDTKSGGRLTIDFQLATTGIELANSEQTLTMAAPAMEISGSLQPLDGGLHLHTLHIMEPQLSAAPARFRQDLGRLFAAPAAERESSKSPRHLAIDSLTVDNGTLQLFSPQQQNPASPPWTSIQVAVKNFNSLRDQNKEQGTFTLSGKQEKTNTSFTWQGAFNDNNVPCGPLQLRAFPASALFDFINLEQSANTSGVADLTGHFTFDPKTEGPGMLSFTDAATEIHDLTLLDRKKAWLAAKTVRIKGAGFKEDDLNLGAVALEGANLTLHQEQLPQLLSHFGNGQRPILIQGLDFSGSADLYPRGDKTQPLQLTNLHLRAGDLGNKSNTQKNFELAAKIHQTGTLKAEGLATLFPLRCQLSLILAAINAEQAAPWLPDAPLFQHGRAIIDGQGTFRYPEPSFTGTLQLGSPLFRGDDKGAGLSAAKAELNNITIKARPARVGMDELILDTPHFTWQQDAAGPSPAWQAGSFLRNLLSPPPSDNGRQQQENGGPAIPLIKKISFDNGTVNYSDQRLNPPWTPAITALKGTITNPHDKTQPATSFEIAGQLDTAPFTLAGSVDFLHDQDTFATQLDVNGLPLSSLAAQIVPLLDINPKSGSVNLSLTHTRQNGEEQGEARLLCTALRPGSSQSATALPLALLTDGNDQLTLLSPIAKNSPQPLLNQAVAAFQTLMVKAEISPLLLTGTEFTDLQENRQIPFAAGQSAMTVAAAEKAQNNVDGAKTLQRFADLLTAHPHLGLVFTGMADPIQDRAAIQQELEEKEKKRTAKKNEARLQEWQKKQKLKQQIPPKAPQVSTSGKIIEEDIPPLEASPAILAPEPVNVPDTMLHDLAQERVLHVYDHCTANLGIASQRITLQEKTVLSAPGTAGNQVLIELRAIYE